MKKCIIHFLESGAKTLYIKGFLYFEKRKQNIRYVAFLAQILEVFLDIEMRLKWLKNFDVLVRSKRQEIAQLRSGIYRSSSLFTEHELSERADTLNAKIIDKSDEILKELESLYEERDRLIKAIEQIKDPFSQLVIRLYYINGLSWYEIQRELPGSAKTLQRARNKALKELEKNIKKTAG